MKIVHIQNYITIIPKAACQSIALDFQSIGWYFFLIFWEIFTIKDPIDLETTFSSYLIWTYVLQAYPIDCVMVQIDQAYVSHPPWSFLGFVMDFLSLFHLFLALFSPPYYKELENSGVLVSTIMLIDWPN